MKTPTQLDMRAIAAEAEADWDYTVPIGGRPIPLLPPSQERSVCTGADYSHRPLPVRIGIWLKRYFLGRDPILAERANAAMHMPEEFRHHVAGWDAQDVLLFCTAGMAAQSAWQQRVFDRVFEQVAARTESAAPAVPAAPAASARPGATMSLRPGGPMPPALGGKAWETETTRKKSSGGDA